MDSTTNKFVTDEERTYLKDYADGIENEISVCEALYLNTSNPIYVWKAISLCFVLQAETKRILQGVTPTLPASSARPFPSWCMAYLSMASVKLSVLQDVVNIGDLDGTEAKKKVLGIFGFTETTANDFDRAKRHLRVRLDDLEFAGLRESLSEKESMERLAANLGIEEVRSVRKRRKEFEQAYAGVTETMFRRPRPRR